MSRSAVAAILGVSLLCWASVLVLLGSDNTFSRRLESEPKSAPSEDNGKRSAHHNRQKDSALSADVVRIQQKGSTRTSMSDGDDNQPKFHRHFNLSKWASVMKHKVNGEEFEEEMVAIHGFTLVLFLLQVIIPITFACAYKFQVVNHTPKLDQRPVNVLQDLPHGICDCWNHCSLCLHLFCCCMCRAAHTWHVAQICEYWPSFCLFCIAGSSKIICVDVCIYTYFRTKIKERLGITPNIPMDCLCHLFCPFCAVGQEALAVDEELGIKVECCCRLTGAAQGRILPEAALIRDAVVIQ